MSNKFANPAVVIIPDERYPFIIKYGELALDPANGWFDVVDIWMLLDRRAKKRGEFIAEICFNGDMLQVTFDKEGRDAEADQDQEA